MRILIACLLLVPTFAHAYAPSFAARMEQSLQAASGEAPLETRGTVSFAPGKVGDAAALAPGAVVLYPAKAALDKRAGTVSFWVRPTWNGTDGRVHSLLADLSDYSNKARNTFYLWKDAAGLLRFDLVSPDGLPLSADVRGWQAGAWHHVAATWAAAGQVALYLDGMPVARRLAGYEPVAWPRLALGGDYAGNGTAEAAFDELCFYDRALDADQVQALFRGQPLEDAAVVGITAPKVVAPGQPFNVQLKVLASGALTRDYALGLELGGMPFATLRVQPGALGWPRGQALDLAPVAVTIPDYLRLRTGVQKLTARLIGAVAPAGTAEAVAELKINSEAPQRAGHTYAVSEQGVPLRDRRPFIPTGTDEGFLYQGRFYRDDAEGRALAADLIKSGLIRDALPVRLLDALSCAGTDHGFVEYGTSLLKELVPGRQFRIAGPANTVTQTTTLDGVAKPLLPGFSYTLKTTPLPVPHVLVAELPDDRLRHTEIALDAAPGSNAAAPLAASGPGETRLLSLCTVSSGGAAPTGRSLAQCYVFYPKSSACVVTVTNSGRERPQAVDSGAAVAGFAVYQLLDTGAALDNPVVPPEEGPRRAVTVSLPEHSFLFSMYGFAGDSAVQRRASLVNACDYLKFIGANRLEFEPLGFNMNAYFSGSRLLNSAGYDLFDTLLPVAEEEGVEVVPLLDALSFYDQLPEFTAASFQLDRDGKTYRQAYGKVPDPLRPEVQSQTLGLLSEFLERVRGKTCVPYVALRADGVAGTCYSGDSTQRPPEEAGYLEDNLTAFAAETGLTLGGTPGDVPGRYAWLREHPDVWDRWVSWRCERMRDFWLKCRDLVVSRGDGRQLAIRTVMPAGAPGMYSYWLSRQTPPLDILRHHGYDPRLYSAERGVRFSRAYPIGAGAYHGGEAGEDLAYAKVYEGLCQTAEGADAELYFTNWALPNHPRGYRVGPAAPVGRSFFRPLIHALRVDNVYNVTFTNWYPGTLGHELDLRRFVRAFRALPALPTQDFEGDVWPRRHNLVARWAGPMHVLVINDSPEARQVRLTFDRALPFGTRITEMGTGQELTQTTGKSKTRIEFTLEPWDLATLEVRELKPSGTSKPRPGQPQN